MLKPINPRIMSTITALMIHMTRISDFLPARATLQASPWSTGCASQFLWCDSEEWLVFMCQWITLRTTQHALEGSLRIFEKHRELILSQLLRQPFE
jgi:hypothetical protein